MQTQTPKISPKIQVDRNDSQNKPTNVHAYDACYDDMEKDMDWLGNIINIRKEERTTSDYDAAPYKSAEEIEKLPVLGNSEYATIIKDYNLSDLERLFLIVAFASRGNPWIFESLLFQDVDANSAYKLQGGVFIEGRGRFLPTMQTVLYLYGGNDLKNKLLNEYQLYNSSLIKENVVHLEHYGSGQQFDYDPIIKLDISYYHSFISGNAPRFDELENFPANELTTNKSFDDLVLEENIFSKLKGLSDFLKATDQQGFKDIENKLKPGYVAIFYGPPGTGKSLTASVIGKSLGIPVYRVDLSRVISKYIGETEKNLEKVFNRLESKKCIIFFDEADALFGKRSEIKDARDRYANQEVSYLLQRIEQCNGLTILATNNHLNLDEAFKRRILRYVFFKPPGNDEQQKLWDNYLPHGFSFEPENLAERLSKGFNFTGGNIVNIMKLACIEAMSNSTNKITYNILEPIMRDEYAKDNKSFMEKRR